MQANDVSNLVSFMLSGGFVAALGTLILGRAKARAIGTQEERSNALLPAELGSATITGAEKSIAIMQGINDRLVVEVARKDDEIAALRAELTSSGHRLAEARAELHRASLKIVELERQYSDFRRRYPEHPGA
jgi:hypothetical protein